VIFAIGMSPVELDERAPVFLRAFPRRRVVGTIAKRLGDRFWPRLRTNPRVHAFTICADRHFRLIHVEFPAALRELHGIIRRLPSG
jgi:hypothetical protein